MSWVATRLLPLPLFWMHEAGRTGCCSRLFLRERCCVVHIWQGGPSPLQVGVLGVVLESGGGKKGIGAEQAQVQVVPRFSYTSQQSGWVGVRESQQMKT